MKKRKRIKKIKEIQKRKIKKKKYLKIKILINSIYKTSPAIAMLLLTHII
jgi:hypothetical protein